MRRYRLFGLLFSLCLCSVLLISHALQPGGSIVAQAAEAPAVVSVTDRVQKTVLDNGLTILTKEVHTAPVVTVQVWYQVGSRNEAPGVNGIAHQLEHMLFKGTQTRPIQFGRLFSALGSQSNAFTSFDQTAYYGTVGKNKLKSLLILEADRMKNAIIDPAQLESEKRVVISEIQGYENNPGYRLSRAVMAQAIPNHPYGLPVGGTKADVQSFTVEQVRQYYEQYYSPDHATVIIVGDFQTEPTLKAVREIFGPLPNRNARTTAEKFKLPKVMESAKTGDRPPIILKEPGSAALYQAVYPLPDINHPDAPVLDVMDYILTEGRSSRFYQALVETGLVSNISGYAATLASGGWYNLSATAARGQELSQIDQAVQETLETFRQKGITPEELKRAKTQLQAELVLQNRDIVDQANQLGYSQTTAGDYRYSDRYLAAISQVTTADVQRVAQTYLSSQNRTVGYFQPTQIAAQTSGTPNPSQTSETFNLGPPVDPAEVAKYLPPVEPLPRGNQALPESITLKNGLKVLLFADRSTPTITLSGFITAGSEYDTPQRAGLANLTASNLMNGTPDKDALTLAKTLEEKGASLRFAAMREGVEIQGTSLAPDLPVLLSTLADVVKNANFPQRELELSRQRALTALKVELDTPARVALRAFQQTIYPPNHPYHNFPTEESLKGLQRDDLVGFKQAYYHPESTVLTLMGDFDPQAVRSLLEASVGAWQNPGNVAQLPYPDVALPNKVTRITSVLPGKTQAITYLGYRGIERRDPRYYAALVLNQILGGDTLSSRLGTEIRDRQGLTYGIYSYFQAGRNAGPFLISMQTSPEDADRAIASTLSLMQDLRKSGVTEAEVRSAKDSLISSYQVSLADPDSLASLILRNQVHGLSPEELREFPAKLQALNVEQINQAAQTLLHPDNLVVVTAGPAVSASR